LPVSRPAAARAEPCGVRRVQAGGYRLCDGGAGHTLPGPGHARRLRRPLPGLRSRLLRLLWAGQGAQCRLPGPAVPDHACAIAHHRPHAAHIQRLVARVPRWPGRLERPVTSREMTMDKPAENTRTITVPALARVEGEGALTIRLRDGQVEHVELRIFE